MKKGIKITLWTMVALLLVSGAAIFYLGYRFAYKSGFNIGGELPARLYVYPGMDWGMVCDSISERTEAPLLWDLKWQLKHRAKGQPIVGAYTIEPNMTVRALYNRLVYGMQTPINFYFNSSRLPEQIYARMDKLLLADSLSIARAMNDSALVHSLGIPDTTLVYYLHPNTYEIYWDITPEKLVKRMAEESKAFWSSDRRSKAEAIGLTPYEVINLAAIVQEESSKVDEYPMIAGLYLNRLRMGMRLQADPTVKFALKDFGLRRIRQEHLRVDSPYNTYQVVGLPKGPIRIPSAEAIDGVLNAEEHHYIYMCAKADFSGYHAFAETYSEHMKNARAYAEELNNRKIN
ncbi:endolytic transglycosylase MltG [Porphyromonas levii]|uniref:Endolytic murein transglycosylase n=1 Tax=Porphyromonas levii TaxID=28114 RepID=A0A4Y8WRZ6_9PORP|nr:endolytic transglycosylase MltG [Porphyromonas levii]MBR8713540.1 Endolytic murein transglycosylase [Porphyromonas levii]MBR8715592.1 Endolytic murein transglycosylase [Porphyromonas levii]MBR8728117.1 Endolytic murein transglycosylase [Porphyromonas levii]MBR8736450.1 Endolytic murein transglycosylase [Porphyromonas levii]MBR8778465.1 Endolytic murein transglycosylase [Porphyromonas levii]